jgi:hypothetical protein
MLSGAVAQLSSSVTAIALNMVNVPIQSFDSPHNSKHLSARQHNAEQLTVPSRHRTSSKDYWLLHETPSGRKTYWYERKYVKHANHVPPHADQPDHSKAKYSRMEDQIQQELDPQIPGIEHEELLSIASTWPADAGVNDFMEMEAREQIGAAPQTDTTAVTAPRTEGTPEPSEQTEADHTPTNGQSPLEINSLLQLHP